MSWMAGRWRLIRLGIWAIGFLLILSVLLVVGALTIVRRSVPMLDGHMPAVGLQQDVSIARDTESVPTIKGETRGDVAYATGFVHAQERFFQMDLLRRSATGELADLVGAAALPMDRERRIHQFARRASVAVAALGADERAVLDHYVQGVNAGLDALKARPFEYFVLRTTPRPWKAEDSLLVTWAMYFELQGRQMQREFARGWLREHSDAAQLAALLRSSSSWDAPLDADSVPAGKYTVAFAGTAPPWMGPPAERVAAAELEFGTAVGSSSWAVAGHRSSSGAALISNDMHLGLSLPNTWFRAVLQYKEGGSERRLVGVTLPGSPLLVAGSNGHVAWGFTNSYGDQLDLVRVELDPAHSGRYRGAEAWQDLKRHEEILSVNGGKSETLSVAETTWGPLWQRGDQHFAVRWVAHDAGAVDLGLMRMESVRSVQEALKVGQSAGIPAQNLVVGDSAGHIGWTIAGALPAREADDSVSFPYAAADVAKGWTALASPAWYPSIIDPASGQLWTANSRQLAGDAQARIGDGGADLGARAKQIRDNLTHLPKVDEAAAYGVSLDDRALYMTTWRDRALKALDDAAVQDHPQRAEYRRLLKEGWTGRANVDSVGYRLARQYLYSLYAGLFGGVDRQLKAIDRDATFGLADTRWPEVLGQLVDTKPPGWLPKDRSDWHAVELAAIDDAIAKLTEKGEALKEANWGRKNQARIAHPFAVSLAPLARWLSAPADPMPGDGHMPRVAAPAFGQSERMIISPGHEDQALFNMPGGQSGHPMSAGFLAGHAAWVGGVAKPLLPGAQAHVLTLAPAAR